MFVVSGRLLAWLQQSLRRWLMVPIVAGILVLALIVTLSAAYGINRALAYSLDNSVALASSVATNAVNQEAHDLSAAMQRAAHLAEEEAIPAVDRPVTVTQLIAAPLYAFGADNLIFLNSDGQVAGSIAITSENPELIPDEPRWLRDEPVRRALADLQSSAEEAPLVRLGITGEQNEALVFVAGRLVSDGVGRGVLVAALPLQTLLRSALDAPAGILVFYDPEGRAVFSTFPASGPALATLPALPASVRQSIGASQIERVTVGGQSYAYGVQPAFSDGQTIGYLGVWCATGDLMASGRRLQFSLVFLIAIGACVTVAASVRQTSRVVQPVTGMVDAARAIAQGDLSRSLPTGGIGELAWLSEAMNLMAARAERQTGVLQEQARQSTYLFEASAELGRTLDFEESLQTAAEAIYGLGLASYVLVLVGRGELGPYVCAAVRGLPHDIVANVQGHQYPVPLWGVMARALVSRQPVVIDDVTEQNRARLGEFNWDIQGGSMLLFPVCGGSGPIALLVVGSDEPNAFSSDQRGDVVFALARIASHSIQNAHLYQEAIRSQEQLVSLQVISRLVASTAPTETVLDVAMREATEAMGDGQAWLYVKDDGTGASRLYSRPKESTAWNQVHQSAVEWVVQAGQPIFYDPSLPLTRSPILVHSGPAMCVPLEVDEVTLGALVLAATQPMRTFVEDDMIVLRTLANAAAAALHTRQVTRHSESGYLELAQAWAQQTDARVWGCVGHVQRVASNAVKVARALGLPADLISRVQVAGLLHDIAAETPADDLLVGEGSDTGSHASRGAEWLAQAGLDGKVATLVRYHHAARPDLVIPDADLSCAAGILALVHAMDIWLQGDAAHAPMAAGEVCQCLIDDRGDKFIPAVLDKSLEMFKSGQFVVP